MTRAPLRLIGWLYATTLVSLVATAATLALVALPRAPNEALLHQLAAYVLEACDQATDVEACIRRAEGHASATVSLLAADGTQIGLPAGALPYCGQASGRIGVVSFCVQPPLSPSSVVAALAFAGLASLLSALFLSRRFVRPLTQLVHAAEGVSAGDLNVRTGLEAGDAFGAVGHAFDTMVEDLRALLDAEKELLASLSHELRTPLSRLSLALEMTAAGEPMDAEALEGLRGDVRDLDELLKELLDAARLQLTEGRAASPMGRITSTQIEVDAWIRASVAEALARFPDTTFRVIPSQASACVRGSERLLRRALRNLLENAARVTEHDTPVVVSAACEGDDVVVRVMDSGPGIPAQDRERVFLPFVRGEVTSSPARGASANLGLGLTMVRRIVQGHAGKVTLDAQDERGTLATLRLPRTEPVEPLVETE